MLKKSSLRSFIWWYSLFYCFFRFQVIHSLNTLPLLVRVCVSILSLTTERYKSKYMSIIIRAINKLTTSHESLQQARFHHINIIFLEGFFKIQKSKGILDGLYHCGSNQIEKQVSLIKSKPQFSLIKLKNKWVKTSQKRLPARNWGFILWH